MAYDLATARLRTGTTTAPTDLEMQNILDTAMAFAERYCSRYFKQDDYFEEYRDRASRTLQLHAFPVDTITAITGNGHTATHDQYGLDKETGILYGSFFAGYKGIDVNYRGGYAVLPLDLEIALWGIFDSLYATMTATTITVAAGGVSSVTLSDVGTVKYDTSGGGTGGGAGFIPLASEAILDLYRLGQV